MHKLVAATLMLAFAPIAFSQGAASPSRAEVKAETRALEKSGKLTPAGEGTSSGPEKNFQSSKTRAERKSETRLAAKNHELIPTGNAGLYKADVALRAQPTTRSRAERRAETRVAEKNRQLIPAGEGPDAPKR